MDSLFEVYLWIQFLGSNICLKSKDLIQEMFESLEVILEEEFPHFELFLIPLIYKECVNADLEVLDEESYPNPFNKCNYSEMKDVDFASLVRDFQANKNIRFWFLIRLMIIVTDKTQMFKDIYFYFFERKMLNCTK